MKTPIGIDLGTTNCCLAYLDREGKPVVLKIEGRITMPSVIAQEANGSYLIGKQAKQCEVPLHRYGFVKRHMGLNVQYPFRDGPLTPSEISSRFLGKLKQHAEELLGEVAAVITVPAHFDENRLTQTREAAIMAGLEVLDIIREPVAAAIAYHQEQRLSSTEKETRILVYDLGGGTMDATLCIREGDHIRIGADGKAYNGDPFLGGLDFDKKLVSFVQPSLREQGVDLSRVDQSDSDGVKEVPLVFQPYMHELLAKAESVKMKLSDNDEAEWVQQLQIGSVDVLIHQRIKRVDYEAAIESFLNQTLDICDKALLIQGKERLGADKRSDSELITKEAQDLDALVLVGGSTRTPAVTHKLSEHFASKFGCSLRIEGFREDECVAIGAAYVASHRLAQQADSRHHGKFCLRWDIQPPSQVPSQKETLPGPTGTIEGPLMPEWSLRLRANDHETDGAIAIAEGGRFALSTLTLTKGKNRFVLALVASDGGERASWDWSVLRGGVSAETTGLAHTIHVRLKQGEAVILPAGTMPNTAHNHTFYIKDKGPLVRMPLYEGYHAIGTLEFAADAPPGTPVDVRATYQPGAIQVAIRIGSGKEEAQSLSMQPHDVPTKLHQYEDRFHQLQTDIVAMFDKIAAKAETVDFLRKQWEFLALDLRTEFEGLAHDLAKIEDRLQRAETMRWHLNLLKNSVESLRTRCAQVREFMQAAGINDGRLVTQLQNIEARLQGQPHQDLLLSIGDEIEELQRSILSRVTLVVTEQQVNEKLEDIRSRLGKIQESTRGDSTMEDFIKRISKMADEIASTKATPNQRLNRLWDLDESNIRERYHTAVVATDRAGLLAETA